MSAGDRPLALVFGASGQIGRPLLARLRTAGWDVIAVSRDARADAPGLRWRRGGFADLEGLPAQVDAIFSCGPLDAFAQWYAHSRVAAPRVVAFGSTSIDVKADSADAHERDNVQRLEHAERALLADALRGHAAMTILRPTLVYGSGRDANLSRIAAIAGRLRCFVLPGDAVGLRQPVHVEDLTDAAFAAQAAATSGGRVYTLGGGEVLPYREMVRRVLQSLDPARPLLVLPPSLFRAALWGARRAGITSGLGDAAVSRLRPNLDVRVGVQVTGTAVNPRVRLFSEPEMSELDKLSWLVLGRASDGLGRADTALLQRAALALLAGDSPGPTEQLLHTIGLDELSVRQNEGEVRETVVSLGNQLSRRWYVGYERSVNATTGTWQLIYRIAQRFTLRAQSGEDSAVDLIWAWRWD